MPNWCGNVVAVFVPKMLIGMTDKVVDAMKGDDGQGGDNWFDLENVLPCPEDLQKPFPEEVVKALEGDGLAQYLPARIRALLMGEGRLTTEDRAAAVAALPDDLKAEAERALLCLDRNGSLTEVQWRMDRWGVRYCCCDEAPTIDDDPSEEYEEPDTVMIRWVFDTPNSWPREAAQELARVCEQWGFGLRWWIAGEDSGSSWNPISDEYIRIWQDASEEAPAVNVSSCAPGCATDAVTIMGGAFGMMLKDEQKEDAA